MRLIEVLALLLLAACCAAEPLTTLVTIPRVSKPPAVDGVLSPGEWSNAAHIPYLVTVRGDAPSVRTTAFACYSGRSLFIAFECGEDLMPKLRAEVDKHDGIVWSDDSVEIFIQPGSSLPYYHIAINSLGTTYDAVNMKIMESDKSWEPRTMAAASRGKAAWFAEIEIPIADVGGSEVKPGDSWRINFCRQRKTLPENISWSPLRFGEATFADPERFGTMVFGDEATPLIHLDEFAGLPNGVVRRSGSLRNPSSREAEITLTLRAGEKSRPVVRTVSIPPGKAASMDASDSIREEGRINAVLECSSGGRVIYRAVRPFDVPPMRSRIADLVRRLEPVDSRTLKAKVGAASREIADIHKAEPERVGEIMRMLDGLEREVLAARLGVETDFVAWAADPWVQLRPGDLPPWEGVPAECRAIACRGERVYAAVNITNFSDRALDLRVVPSIADVPAEHVALHTCAFVPLEARSAEMIGDALPLADGAGGEGVPPGQTRQAFLVIRTDGLEPGEYSGAIRVVPTADPAQEVALRFTVYPLDLPSEPKPWICTWGGLLGVGWTKPHQRAYFQDALDRGVNIFFMNPASVAPKLREDGSYPPIDFTALDRQIRDHAGCPMAIGAYSISLQYDGWARKAGITYMSDAYRKGFVSWVRDWVAHLKGLGLSYDDFAFELVDEPSPDEKLQMHIDTGKLMREADPRARIVCTTNFADLDKLERISPFVDVWIPQGKVLEDPAAREFMKRTGREMWMYVCEGDSKRRSPVTYYRVLPWQAFRYDLTGWGFFAHMWYGESPWEATNASGKYLATYSTIYPGLSGPVTSRRWECYFKGHEDFRALHLLKSLVARAEKAGLDVVDARKVLQEAVDGSAGLQRMKSDAEASAFLADIRRRVADASVKLSNALHRRRE